MKIILISFSSFKTNGAEMFKNVPEIQWKKLYQADENNHCNWAVRSLLIDDGKNVVLIDSGFGNSNQKIINEYHIENFKTACNILNEKGLNDTRITHVIHTHLHLDHCGGSFNVLTGGQSVPAFPNAQYILACRN